MYHTYATNRLQPTPRPWSKLLHRTKKPAPNIKNTLDKLNRSVRLKVWLKEHPIENDENYNPNLYLPSRWKPPEASNTIEQNLKTFAEKLKEITKQNTEKATPKSNLTRLQKNCLQKIMNDKRYIVCLSDKNLGPVLMERRTYFERCLSDHLLCSNTYVQLTEKEATEQILHTRKTLLQLRLNYRKDLTETENTYFRRNANIKHRLPQFYIIIKIHKQPYKTRPIVSCVGSFLNAFSKWVDTHLQKLLPFNPTYTKDTSHVLQDIENPKSTKSLKTFHLQRRIHVHQHQQHTWNRNHKKIIMSNNIFQFDDTYWLQKCGTAMGTSCACSYATLYWAYIERKFIIPKWSHSLPFLRRYIDDKFGIWTGSEENFIAFLQDLNSYSQLKWTSSGLSSSVNFLDITITIESDGKISTKTFQKPTNLHLYIPPSSAHTPGVLKSLIFGNLQRYWEQNTYVSDFTDITKQFATRLIARGYDKHTIKHLFSEAAKKLDNFVKQQKTNSDTLYLHWLWHPRCIAKPKLRLLYKNTLQEHSGFKNLIICYSRPKNLRDSLMQTKLQEPEGKNISNLLLQNN
jgi:hypothetical protein